MSRLLFGMLRVSAHANVSLESMDVFLFFIFRQRQKFHICGQVEDCHLEMLQM